MKKEANFGIILRHWLRANPLVESCPIEIKDSRGKNWFDLDEWKKEQRDNARASKGEKGNLIRISSGTIGGPDYAYFINAPVHLWIRYPDFFVAIEISKLLRHDRRLTEVQAKKLSDILIKL